MVDRYVTKSQFAEIAGISPAMVTKLLKNGTLTPSLSDDKKLLNLDKAMSLYSNSPKRNYNNKSNTLKKIPKEIKTEEAERQLALLLKDSDIPPLVKVQIVDKYWIGRLSRQKFKKEEGELIQVSQAKAVFSKFLIPFNQMLNDLPFLIKETDPNVSDDTVEWIRKHIDDTKINVQNMKFA